MDSDIMLQIINMSVATYETNSGVGRSGLARLFGCTPKTVAARLEQLITSKMVAEYRVSAPRGRGFKYLYNLTPKSLEYLTNNYERIRDKYRAYQQLMIIQELAAIRRPIKSEKSKKQLEREKNYGKALF